MSHAPRRRAAHARAGGRHATRPAPMVPGASPRRVLLGLAAAGLAFILMLGGFIIFDTIEDGLESATESAQLIATACARGIVEPRLSREVVAADPRALADLDAAIRRYVLTEGLVRVKLMTEAGRVIYSDEARLIGNTYPFDPQQRAAVRERQVRSARSDPELPENRYEVEQPGLLEVYVGVAGSDGQPLLFEAYFRHDAARRDMQSTWWRFGPPVLSALILLHAMHLAAAWSLTHRYRRDRDRLLSYAVDTAAAERRRVAGDLHDGVVQELTGLGYELDARSRAGPVAADVPDVLANAAARLRSSVDALRTLLVDVYPPELDRAGLAGALHELAGRARRAGIEVELRAEDVGGVPERPAAVLFRAAQEAMRNVVAHSGARHVRLLGQVRDQRATLLVADDGAGFDETALPARARQGHMGLRLLAGLTAEVGGQLRVHTAPGQGTTVEIEVPLS